MREISAERFEQLERQVRRLRRVLGRSVVGERPDRGAEIQHQHILVAYREDERASPSE
jgi:hypothetical protein